MQVLVFNSSPNQNKGATGAILNPFLDGVKEAGAEVEEIYVHKLAIKPCRGCFTCWTKTPGKCTQKDDMTEILPKITLADIIVFATPVYVDGMTSTMKCLLDRSIPLIKGIVEIRDDHCRHPRRNNKNPGKVVLVSVSGFTELDNFEPLIAHIKAACKNMGSQYMGAIIRPYAWAFSLLDNDGANIVEVLQAVKEAGSQVVKDGKFSPKTLSTISQELAPREEIIKYLNAYFGQFEQ
ncbi:MAG: flavodoxin family protein [Candidatus Hodarchaeota archaeon]